MDRATSPSAVGGELLEWLISVAGMPSAVKIVANSTPTGPPPTITTSFGTLRMETIRSRPCHVRVVERDACGAGGARPGRDQDRARGQLAASAVGQGDEQSAVPAEAGGALQVVGA